MAGRLPGRAVAEGAGLMARAELSAALLPSISELPSTKPGKSGRSWHQLEQTWAARSSSASRRARGRDPQRFLWDSAFSICVGLGFFFFCFPPKGSEELLGRAASLGLHQAGFATWPSQQCLDEELNWREGLGVAKEDPPQALLLGNPQPSVPRGRLPITHLL